MIEIVPTVRFYDYEAKYAPGGSRHLLPAPISPFVYQQVRELALGAHKALGCRGVSRADFRLRRPPRGDGGTGLSRGQHATWHDRDLARARARGVTRAFRLTSLCDGWSRTHRSIADPDRAAARPPADRRARRAASRVRSHQAPLRTRSGFGGSCSAAGSGSCASGVPRGAGIAAAIAVHPRRPRLRHGQGRARARRSSTFLEGRARPGRQCGRLPHRAT